MKKLVKYPLLILFCAFILLISLFDVLTPVQEYSEMENRPLEQTPKMSWTSLVAKKDEQKYTMKYEKYINDQFLWRDGWITLKSVSESALGKLENNGIVYGGENHMFEKYRSTDDWRIEKNVEFVSSFIKQYSDKSPVTFALLPSSYAVYPELLPAELQNVDQKSYIQRIYGMLPEQTVRFDAFPALEQGKSSDIYYRTDHHWTTQGAYLVYQALMQSKGRAVVPMEELSGYQHTVSDFYGTYYSKSKLYSALPDTITYYELPSVETQIDGVAKDSMYQFEQWEARDKYAAFLWGNNGLTVLKSQNNLDKKEGETSRVLLIKDSYGNCFAPYLTYSYDEVYVIDLRSVAGLSEAIGQTEFDDIFVMYSFMNFSSDTNLARLTY